jgi:hypothetical protein
MYKSIICKLDEIYHVPLIRKKEKKKKSYSDIVRMIMFGIKLIEL